MPRNQNFIEKMMYFLCIYHPPSQNGTKLFGELSSNLLLILNNYGGIVLA